MCSVETKRRTTGNTYWPCFVNKVSSRRIAAGCRGFGRGDGVIEPKTRSMMNQAMIGALGKMHEWEIRCRVALNNGVSAEEIRAIIHVVGIDCGVPQSLECFRVARRVLEGAGQR